MQQVLTLNQSVSTIDTILCYDKANPRYSKRKAVMEAVKLEVDIYTGTRSAPKEVAAAPASLARASSHAPAGASLSRASSGAPGGARQSNNKRPSPVISALALVNGRDGDFLYATGVDNTLWKLNVKEPSNDWVKIGAALNVVAMGAHVGWLYCVDKQQSIWQMDLYAAAPNWLPFERCTLGKLRTLTAFDGYLYGATNDHKLVRREIKGTGWKEVNKAQDVIGLASCNHRLYACCSNLVIWSMDLTTNLTNPFAWQDCGTTSFPSKYGFCCGHDGKLIAADHEALWCRELDKLAGWKQYGSLPAVAGGAGAAGGGGGTKRPAPEAVPYTGDVKQLKQWRGDLVEKYESAKATYTAALDDLEKWRAELMAQTK